MPGWCGVPMGIRPWRTARSRVRGAKMSHLPGKFVWFEHSSTDFPTARKFYEPLFNWHTELMAVGEQRYPMIFNGADSIGGYRSAAAGERAHWVAYLSVDDVDTAFARAVAAGAK